MTLSQYKEKIEILMMRHGRDIDLIVLKEELDGGTYAVNIIYNIGIEAINKCKI